MTISWNNVADKITAGTGGGLGAYSALQDGLTLIPEILLQHVPHWLNYGVHCAIGTIIGLSLTRGWNWIFNNKTDSKNGKH